MDLRQYIVNGRCEIPEGVVEIPDSCFVRCNALEEVRIPGSVKRIGSSAFLECLGLKTVEICDGAMIIEECAFYGCKCLKSVKIGEGVSCIGKNAFHYCISLRSIRIPPSVVRIGQYAFSNCFNLINVDMGEKMVLQRMNNEKLPERVIERNAFYFCESLKSIKIAPGVKKIEESVFKGCDSLTNVKIGEGATHIGRGVFDCCMRLYRCCLPDKFCTSMQRQSLAINKDAWLLEALDENACGQVEKTDFNSIEKEMVKQRIIPKVRTKLDTIAPRVQSSWEF